MKGDSMKHIKNYNGEMQSGGTDSRATERPKPLAHDVLRKIERQQVDRPTHSSHYPPVKPSEKK
jgi:hypothetical protein